MTEKRTTIANFAYKYCPKVKLNRTFLPQSETCSHIFAPNINLCANFYTKANLKNVFLTKLG